MYHEIWTASCILLIFGAVAAAAGVWIRFQAERKAPYRGHAEARVVDIVTVPRTGAEQLSEFRNRQAAVFEFYAEGHPVKLTDTSCTYPCPYHRNERVQICYNPDNPKEYCIVKTDKWKRLTGVCNALSMVLLLAGCALFLAFAARG